MAENIDVMSSVARLVELEKQMNSLDESFKNGKLSLDAYNKSLTALEGEVDGLSKALLRQGEDVDSLVDSYKSINKVQDEGTKKVKEYEMSYDKVGSTANAALSIVASGISKTNPMLATAISGVQKLIPNIVELGNAARTAGSLMKGLASSAGIGLVIVALTEVVDIVSKIVSKHKEQAQAAEDAKNAEVAAAKDAKDAWLDYWNSIKGKIDSRSDSQRELDTLNANIAAIEKRREEFAKHGAVLEKEYQDQLEAGYARRLQLEKQIQDERKKGSGGSPKPDILKQLEDDEKALESAWEELMMNLNASSEDMANDYYDSIVRIAHDSLAQTAHDVDELSESENSRKEYLDSIYSSVMTQAEKEMAIMEEEMAIMDDKIAKEKIIAELKKKIEEDEKRRLEEEKRRRIDLTTASLDAAANLTDGLASLYESDEKNAKKNAKKIKGLKIASATIDMLNGAVKAFTSAMELGPIAGPIVGGVNAASVIAMGMANINKIKSTSEDGSSSVSPSVSATPVVTQTYTLNKDYSTSEDLASLRDSLNAQKVVLVVDDVTKVQDTSTRVQTQASF